MGEVDLLDLVYLQHHPAVDDHHNGQLHQHYVAEGVVVEVPPQVKQGNFLNGGEFVVPILINYGL